VQAGNIRCDGIRRAHVFNNIIRNGKALFARRLGGKNMFCMFRLTRSRSIVRAICVSFGTSTTSTRSACAASRFSTSKGRPRE
jgi:hypothetical protein